MADGIGLDERIRFAIARRRLVEFRYSDTTRIAEPHDYGMQNGRARLLVFQLRGPSRPGHPQSGWRRLDTAKIAAVTVLDHSFRGSRGESHGDHLQWDVVYARVK